MSSLHQSESRDIETAPTAYAVAMKFTSGEVTSIMLYDVERRSQ